MHYALMYIIKKAIKLFWRLTMRIPVFVSCPTELNEEQGKFREFIEEILIDLQLESRALGKGDYPSELPLREVLAISKHCSGGIILGFSQYYAKSVTKKRGCGESEKEITDIHFPTPWNQLEAGILFAMHLPILIFCESSIEGGIFDRGVTDVYVHKMPESNLSEEKKGELKQVFLKWSAQVRSVYYGDRKNGL
jgi:hypothetical protein